MTHPVSRYVPLLIDGDIEGLVDLFGNAPRVNDPRLGWVEGTLFEQFVATSSNGLVERRAQVEHLTTTSTSLGAVEECILTLARGGEMVRLPVAIAAVLASDVLTSVHVYHSMRPLMGAHAIRPPVLPPRGPGSSSPTSWPATTSGWPRGTCPACSSSSTTRGWCGSPAGRRRPTGERAPCSGSSRGCSRGAGWGWSAAP